MCLADWRVDDRCAPLNVTLTALDGSVAAAASVSSEHILYMTPRDPLVDGLGSSNENGVSVLAAQGTTRLSASQYGALAAAYQPDIVASLSDEVPSSVASNRARKASQRSVMWADEMQRAMAASRAAAGAPPKRKTLFFASVQGGSDLEQRRTSCAEYSRRAALADAEAKAAAPGSAAAATAAAPAAGSIDGFVIGGLGSGEDVAKREEIVAHVVVSHWCTLHAGALPAAGHDAQFALVLSLTSPYLCAIRLSVRVVCVCVCACLQKHLPASKARVLSSSSVLHGSPEEVLRGVAAGIDLFEVEYPHQLTLLGQASVFPVGADEATADGAPPSALPVTKLHLRDSRYAHDQGPILRGCTCFTCANHTRAYLHHLLNVHEMTAPVLLDLHNLHHYSRFMAAIRASLAAPASQPEQGFAAFRAQFLARFLPPATVTALHAAGPRHAHQVGRALLGPFAAAVAAVGPFVLRRILPKDEPLVAALVRRVLASFGASGPGYATQDPELDYMWRAYETQNLPPQSNAQQPQLGENDMVDAPPAPTAAAAAAAAAPSTGPMGAPAAAPLRSAYFVVTRSTDDSVVLGGAGFAALEGSDPAAGVAELRKMYLDPEARGQGVGQALLDQIFPAARAAGFSSIYLETLPNMEAALAIYKKNGFVRLDAPMGNTGHTACGERFLKQL